MTEEAFRAAAKHAASPACSGASRDQKSRLYGYYKQALNGDVSGKRPGIVNPVGRLKWDAWAVLKGTSAAMARDAYIKIVQDIDSTFTPHESQGHENSLSSSTAKTAVSLFSASKASKNATFVLPIGTPAGEQLDRLLWLLEDEQLLEADRQLRQLRDAPDVAEVKVRLGELTPQLVYLEKQAAEVRHAKAEFDTETGWVRVMRLFGITTYYKVEEGNRCLFVKMEGEMEDLSVLQLAAVIREIDLFKTWMPFCCVSSILRWYSRANVFAQLAIAFPLFYRDSIVHAYACDMTAEDGSFLILGRSIDEVDTETGEILLRYKGHPSSSKEKNECGRRVASSVEKKTTTARNGEAGRNSDEQKGDLIPRVNKNASYGSCGRMDIKAVRAQFTMLTATRVRACIVACVDPRMPLPMSIINFGIKNVAGVLLGVLASTARRIRSNPGKSKHFARITADNDGFYREWLWPKCKRFYNIQGWAEDRKLAQLLGFDQSSSSSEATVAAKASSIVDEIESGAATKRIHEYLPVEAGISKNNPSKWTAVDSLLLFTLILLVGLLGILLFAGFK